MHATAIVADVGVKDHIPGAAHPEHPSRFSAVVDQLNYSGLMDELLQLQPKQISNDDLALVHTREYIALVEREVDGGVRQLSTGDTDVAGHGSLTAAHIAVGSAMSAVDAVMKRDVQNAFCVVRPPGHHASADRGMGFCLFNNVAIAARYAQQRYQAERVLIADWDVHHGNGTQDIFYEDGSVLFFSTHQSPWYPGTGNAGEHGEGRGAGLTLNHPLPAGSRREQILGAFQTSLLPAAEAFKPDLVLISAGFDSRAGDPLGQFLLTDTDFADLTELLMGVADQFCEGRVVSLLEGGYSLPGLAAGSSAHVKRLSEG